MKCWELSSDLTHANLARLPQTQSNRKSSKFLDIYGQQVSLPSVVPNSLSEADTLWRGGGGDGSKYLFVVTCFFQVFVLYNLIKSLTTWIPVFKLSEKWIWFPRLSLLKRVVQAGERRSSNVLANVCEDFHLTAVNAEEQDLPKSLCCWEENICLHVVVSSGIVDNSLWCDPLSPP